MEEFSDDTTPSEMEEYVNNEDDDEKEITEKNEYECVIHIDIIEYEKDTIRDTLDKVIEEFPDETFPVDIQECVTDKVDDGNEKNDEEKEENEKTDYESTTIGEVKVVKDERGGKYYSLVK